MGNGVPISTVTGSIVPGTRVTVRVSLSTLPKGILRLVAPPRTLPFLTRIGSTILSGAPVGATALNSPSATHSNETVRGIGSTVLPLRSSDCSENRPLKAPAGILSKLLFTSVSRSRKERPLKMFVGRLLKALSLRWSDVNSERPLKTPAGRLLKALSFRWSDINSERPLKTPAGRLLKPVLYR